MDGRKTTIGKLEIDRYLYGCLDRGKEALS